MSTQTDGEQPVPAPTEDAPVASQRELDPQKLLRIASLAREVLEEARRIAPQSDAGGDQLAAVYKQVKKQLHAALPEQLVEELESIDLDLPFRDGATSEEARIAYSALIGWIGGLFQGMQAATLQAQAIMELERGRGNPTEAKGPDKEGYL